MLGNGQGQRKNNMLMGEGERGKNGARESGETKIFSSCLAMSCHLAVEPRALQ